MSDPERTVIVNISLTVEGQSLPEITSMIRVKWPHGRTLQELMDAEADRICRQLHAPKQIWTTA